MMRNRGMNQPSEETRKVAGSVEDGEKERVGRGEERRGQEAMRVM